MGCRLLSIPEDFYKKIPNVEFWGSGKTYSFVGNYESEPQVLGLMPRTLQRLLELRPEMEMRLSVAEAYSDNLKAITLYDLLKPRKEGNQLRRASKKQANFVTHEHNFITFETFWNQ